MIDDIVRSRRCLLFLSLAALCITALIAVPEAAWSQTVTASITGRVLDPSGAAIPGAKVTATDAARGTALTTETNAEGFFNLPRLPIGTYEVRVEATGFKTSVRPPLVLELNQTARMDVTMSIGEVAQTVEVTSAPPLLSTDTMQVGTIIDSKVNEALPLASRNYIQLTMLAAGVTNPNPDSMKNPLTTGQSGRPYVNGNREQSNNFMLDGLDNNQVSDNVAGYTPSPDAIQEFNMITNNAPADFGNFQGGVVSASIKSGTNEYHGTAYEFFRNDVLNANNWATNWAGGGKNKMRWNMFGGTFGGPIIKDKLFVFGDYMGIRYHTPASTGPITVFTAKERQGDFSELLDRGIQLYNPLSTRPDPADPTKTIRDPFVNNQIPLSMMSPVVRNLFADTSLYPMPTNGQLQNNYLNTNTSTQTGDQYDIKMDWNMTERNKISGRYSQSWQKNPTTNSFPLSFGSFWQAPVQSGVATWTRTFSPSIVNDVRVGVNYISLWSGQEDSAGLGNVADELGIQNGNDRGPGLFGMSFQNNYVGGFGAVNMGTQQKFPSTVIQASDDLVWTKSSHTLHMGFQFFRTRINPFYAGNYGRTGNMIFDGMWTSGPNIYAPPGSGVGAGEADFFLGLPGTVQRGVNTGSWGHRSNRIGAYIQDNWRVTPALTLNLGLRYETHTPWVEVKDRQTNFQPFTGTQEYAGQSTYFKNSRALYNPYNWGIGNFQPRFGFSWNPDWNNRAFVFRGAYTVSGYLEGTGTNLRLPLNPPLNEEFNNIYASKGYPTLGSTLEQGMTVLKSSDDPYKNAVIRLWNEDIKPAIAQQWNLSAEYQFGSDTTLMVGYVGQKGTHLMNPMPYFQRHLLGLNPDGSPNTSPSPYLAGNPDLASIGQISGTESNGNMRYDALQTVLRKRFSKGLSYQVAYTWSKAMTDSAGYYGSWGGQVTPPGCYWQNLYDKKAEWGPSFFDVRNLLTSYAVYDLPIGKGKTYGNDWNPVARGILGDWAVTGIVTWRGGFPSNIYGSDATGTGSRSPRPDLVGPKTTFGKQNAPDGGYQWFDSTAYEQAATGTFGNAGNGTEYGPGLFELDLSLQKNFPITESKRVEFRAEFINFTNTPILNGPGVWLGGGLGKVQGSQGPRNIQFGLKIYY